MSSGAQVDAKRVLRFDGSLTLPRAETIRSILAGALDEGGGVAIDCEGATEVDVSFIQLLLAARRSAAHRGASLALAAPAAGALRTALERGGFLTAASKGGASDSDFWG
ncbi:MAG: STAS domain-containing protein [Stellaceae bacterium]